MEGQVEALGLIICRLDELRHLAAAQGLEFLGYLLDVAFNGVMRRDQKAAFSRARPRNGGLAFDNKNSVGGQAG